jgi:rubrerythrin
MFDIIKLRRKKMSLKGTKTKENLEAAFAGESQANRRYLYFAQKADVQVVRLIPACALGIWHRPFA